MSSEMFEEYRRLMIAAGLEPTLLKEEKRYQEIMDTARTMEQPAAWLWIRVRTDYPQQEPNDWFKSHGVFGVLALDEALAYWRPQDGDLLRSKLQDERDWYVRLHAEPKLESLASLIEEEAKAEKQWWQFWR